MLSKICFDMAWHVVFSAVHLLNNQGFNKKKQKNNVSKCWVYSWTEWLSRDDWVGPGEDRECAVWSDPLMTTCLVHVARNFRNFLFFFPNSEFLGWKHQSGSEEPENTDSFVQPVSLQVV